VIEYVTNLGELNKDNNFDECYTDAYSRNIHKFTHHEIQTMSVLEDTMADTITHELAIFR